MTLKEEIEDLEKKLNDNYSEEAKVIFRIMKNEREEKLNPQVVIEINKKNKNS
jgi:hypothetical protein